uniref:Uncharacterized protein n=1 Tax=Sinorhizobium meliloti (strain SM11) TaxID=707241 RepID=A4KVJ1_SINMM|nr:hypothetical protein [Sinorhizobium meliloti SM11]
MVLRPEEKLSNRIDEFVWIFDHHRMAGAGNFA